jgi:hypothetical protein
MIKATSIAWLSALVVFVGTLPHAVGATFIKAHTTFTHMSMNLKPCMEPIIHSKTMAKKIAREKVLRMYNSNYEWKALYKLWMKESKFDYTADNPHSSAYGIPQLLKLNTETPMVRQIELGLKYIQHRYGTPTRALAFHNIHGWY